MKIEKLSFSGHPILGDMELDFTGPEGKPLDTIVLAGVNGSGKTTMLELIREIMLGRFPDYRLILSISHIPELGLGNIEFIRSNDTSPGLYQFRGLEGIEKIDVKRRPRVVYMPTEINFNELQTQSLSFTWEYQAINTIDRKLIENIPSFIASLINGEVFANPDLPAKQAIDKVCLEINTLFDILEIDALLIGLEPTGKLPLFVNSAGNTFDINHLSSGEKQVFVRALALKMVQANNSIILIDEPEISLHPRWQQRIMKVYERIGENNQVIAATHSPHVVSSVRKESVKLLKRRNGRIEVVDYKNIDGSLGLPVDIVLQALMELDSTRDPEVQEDLTSLWDMVHSRSFESDEFKRLYGKLEELLGTEDEDLLLMRIEIAKLKANTEKAHAGDQKGR